MNLPFRQAGTTLLVSCIALSSAAAVMPPHISAPIHRGDTPPPGPVIDMQHTSWTARDGAPTGIYGITQTPDGWLWIGSTSGLFRFDGVRFERAEGALAPLSSNTHEMGLLHDGSLWISYKFGGLSLMKDGRMRHFRAGERNLPEGTITQVGQDADGRVWIGSTRGLLVLADDGSWHAPDSALGAPDGIATSMLLDSRGTFWVRTDAGVFALPRHGTQFERKQAAIGPGKLAEYRDGSIWVSGDLRVGLHLVEGRTGTDPHAWDTDDLIDVFLFDHAGNRWQPGHFGITLTAAEGTARQQRTDAAHGLSGLHAWPVFEDREQNIWAGTENGLDRFRPYRLRSIPLPMYLSEARPLAAGIDGGAWIDRSFLATATAAPTNFGPTSTQTDSTTALYASPDGTLWSGGIGGLWKTRNGKREAVPMPPGLANPMAMPVLSMTGDTDGTLWVSLGRMGVYALRAGQWSPHGGVAGLASFGTTAIAADARGRMWFGSVGDQLRLLDHGIVRRFGRDDGIRTGTVLAILPTADGAWIGGENGLSHFDGTRFVAVTGRGGEPFAGTSGIVFARDGTLWLNGGAGLSSIAPNELQQALRDPAYHVHFERLDYRDGLPGTAAPIIPLPSAIRTRDGTLWFSTQGGVVAFDPATLPRNRRAPPVQVTTLLAGDKAYPAQDGLTLPPHTSALQVDFTALSYRAPERMDFRYQLAGVDHGWQDSDGRRSARYTNLAPGRYRFRVIASNDDGVWNEQGAAVAFEIAPSLTQTAWFRLLCGGAALAVLWLLHRLRLRSVARRLAAQMNARLAERERIARELHDTLLQAIHGLVLKFDAAVQRLRPDERAPLEEALDRANQVLGEGRDRVAGLRGDSLAATDLAGALADVCAPLARDAGIRFDLAAHGAAVALDAAVAAEVLAIAREAVWNAVVHAEAGAVTVTLQYTPWCLSLAIADDGRGMPADVAANGRAGHWGLAGMRERAEKIGGTLELATRAGAGTTWTLHVPHGAVNADDSVAAALGRTA